jgi:prepilin-type N-terminal cleavage/methylation domain-containing protein
VWLNLGVFKPIYISKRFSAKAALHLSRGFTLVELMTVVVIIGILSTVALPSYQKYTLNSKMAEASVIMSGIQKSEIMYQANTGFFMSLFRSTSLRPPGKQRANQLDLTDSWEEISYPVIAESDYYFTYAALAGGTFEDGDPQVMGMGTETPSLGTWDGVTFITSRAIRAGNCTDTVDYSSYGFNTVNNEKWVILYAATDFVETTPIVCTSFISVIRLSDTGLTVSPLISLNPGQ